MNGPMTPERWRQVTEVSTRHRRARRSPVRNYLDVACGGDPSLRAGGRLHARGTLGGGAARSASLARASLLRTCRGLPPAQWSVRIASSS